MAKLAIQARATVDLPLVPSYWLDTGSSTLTTNPHEAASWKSAGRTVQGLFTLDDVRNIVQKVFD